MWATTWPDLLFESGSGNLSNFPTQTQNEDQKVKVTGTPLQLTPKSKIKWKEKRALQVIRFSSLKVLTVLAWVLKKGFKHLLENRPQRQT